MARIPYFDPAEAQGRAKAHYARLPDLNIFRMLGHSGELLDGFSRMGGQILNFTDLDPVLREIAIIRTGVLCGSSYEVHQHKRIGRSLGMSPDLLAGVEAGPEAAVFDETQRLVMRFTDDVVRHVRASDATFDPLSRILPYKQMQELVIAIGFYMLVSRFLETFDVEIEAAATVPDDQMPGVARGKS